ncbi:MAG TPA: ribonuclease H-like domain-containing protein, partial [Elusimicrobiales bacterium]|nr:ribonuclease H-like domain-containing protein [Elusimicrobiales bacterium]
APREASVPENSPYETEKARRERELRRQWAAEHFPGFVAVENARGQEALSLTLKYMEEGRSAIQYPALWFLPRHLYGKANLIVRSDSAPSVFGPYHYTLVQLKQALEVKQHYCIQSAMLNRILGLMQGYEPPEFRLFLRTKDIILRQQDWENALTEVLDTWSVIKDGLLEPEPGKPPGAASAPWRIYANKLVYTRKDLVLLAGVSRENRQKLHAAGIHTVDESAHAGLDKLTALTDEQSGPEIFGNAATYVLQSPILRSAAAFTLPTRERNLYFDFENADALRPGEAPYVYLIGVWDAESRSYTGLLAKNAAEEEKIFAQFADLVGAPERATLYHWTEHET